MITKDLILSLNFDDIWNQIKNYYYSDLSENLGYLKFKKLYPEKCETDFLEIIRNNLVLTFQDVKGITVKPQENKVLTVQQYYEYEDSTNTIETIWSVCFYEKGTPYSYSLMGIPWDDFLGLEILPQSIEKYGKLNVAAHIVWELTYMGYTQKVAEEESLKLAQRLNESSKSNEFYTLEEVEEHLADVCTNSEEERVEFLNEIRSHTDFSQNELFLKAVNMTNELSQKFNEYVSEYFSD